MPKPITMKENALETKPNQNQEMDDILSDLTLAERLKLFSYMNKKDVDIEGEGIKSIIQSLKNKREGISLALKGNRMNYPPSSRTVLDKYGDKPLDLTQIKVCRKPLDAVLQKVIKGVATKKLAYDKIFHLSIRFKVKDGPVVRIDKRETTQIKIDDDMVDTECIKIEPSAGTPSTINEILENTRKLMGDTKFYTYSASTNNCQIFVLNIMKANGLTGDTSFIKQDVNELIPTFFSKLSDIGTDIKSRLSLITEGKGIFGETHPLSLGELENYYKGKKFYQGTFMSNALPQKIKNNCSMIINLEDIETQGQGTHWVCCIRKDKTNFYFDSYGLPCDDDVLQMFKKSGGKSVYNDKQLQKLETVTCGYYCVYVIDKCLEENQPLDAVLKTMNSIPKNEKKVVAHTKRSSTKAIKTK